MRDSPRVRPLSQSDVEKIKDIVAKAKLSEPAKYEWRPARTGLLSAVAWNGSDEVGRIEQFDTKTAHKWRWSATALLASEFHGQVATTGWAGTAHEAAALTEAAYDGLMRLYDRSEDATTNRQVDGRKRRHNGRNGGGGVRPKGAD